MSKYDPCAILVSRDGGPVTGQDFRQTEVGWVPPEPSKLHLLPPCLISPMQLDHENMHLSPGECALSARLRRRESAVLGRNKDSSWISTSRGRRGRSRFDNLFKAATWIDVTSSWYYVQLSSCSTWCAPLLGVSVRSSFSMSRATTAIAAFSGTTSLV